MMWELDNDTLTTPDQGEQQQGQGEAGIVSIMTYHDLEYILWRAFPDKLGLTTSDKSLWCLDPNSWLKFSCSLRHNKHFIRTNLWTLNNNFWCGLAELHFTNTSQLHNCHKFSPRIFYCKSLQQFSLLRKRLKSGEAEAHPGDAFWTQQSWSGAGASTLLSPGDKETKENHVLNEEFRFFFQGGSTNNI